MPDFKTCPTCLRVHATPFIHCAICRTYPIKSPQRAAKSQPEYERQLILTRNLISELIFVELSERIADVTEDDGSTYTVEPYTYKNFAGCRILRNNPNGSTEWIAAVRIFAPRDFEPQAFTVEINVKYIKSSKFSFAWFTAFDCSRPAHKIGSMIRRRKESHRFVRLFSKMLDM